MDLIFDIFSEELNSEISERINLSIIYIESLLKSTQYMSVGETSTINIEQNDHGDLYFRKSPSKISKEIYGEKRHIQQDLFENAIGGIFEYKKVELSEEFSSLNIYEHPDSIYLSLVEFCIKNSYFPVELKKIKIGNIKPLIANTATFGYDKLLLRSFEDFLEKKFHSRKSIVFGTQGNSGYIEIYPDRIEIIDENDNLITKIEKELVGPLLIGLNHLPGRSIDTINKKNDIFIEKYLPKKQNHGIERF